MADKGELDSPRLGDDQAEEEDKTAKRQAAVKPKIKQKAVAGAGSD